MSVLVYVVAMVLACRATAEVVDLSCDDNATCIEGLTRQLVRGIRSQKPVRLFGTVLIEPLPQRQARSGQGALERFLSTHALSFDWEDYSFRFSKPASRSGAVEMEVFTGRAVEEAEADEPTVTKKGSEEKEEAKPKRRIIRRRQKKRILQALLPMILGMKSAGTVLLAIAAVAALTMKAFVASKLALLVTVGMAAKRLYESFGQGVGLQNHPYLYSQYPVDFPSASSHAYSVNGVSNPQFASPELFGATALASHTHQHEMLQQSDASAQQSQSAPTLQLANATRASERWDGKSRLLEVLKKAVDKVKSVLTPLAGKIVDVMPASFRGITSKAFGLDAKEKEDDLEDFMESRVPKGIDIEASNHYFPKQILIPKPRLLSRKSGEVKSNSNKKYGPKKVINKPMDLAKLKENKDLDDYIKTKKYLYNYGNTHFYPRMKYFIEPTTRSPYGQMSKQIVTSPYIKLVQPSPVFQRIASNISASLAPSSKFQYSYVTTLPKYNFIQPIVVKRQKREVDYDSKMLRYENKKINKNTQEVYLEKNEQRRFVWKSIGEKIARGLSDLFFNTNPVNDLLKQVDDYVKSHTSPKKPHKPLATTSQKIYYVGVEMIMFSLQILDVYVNMADSIMNHLGSDEHTKKKHRKINRRKSQFEHEKKNKTKDIKNKVYNKQLKNNVHKHQ